MSTEKKYALIVAGGKGTRMGTDVPKQFLLLKGIPVLMHTIRKFSEAGCDELILVLPEAQVNEWKALCRQYDFTIPHHIVTGGQERFYSVKNGLALVDKLSVVAIHDGVRPCVTTGLIKKCFHEAIHNGSAVAAVKPKESLRMKKDNRTVAVDRDMFYSVQTPQVFVGDYIKKAYEQPFTTQFTDDATVYEAAGNLSHVVEGDYRNIKITTPEDLILAEMFL
jgi:2-C-methyl-D-erythritol 4-phosphate cytidylyltransferase